MPYLYKAILQDKHYAYDEEFCLLTGRPPILLMVASSLREDPKRCPAKPKIQLPSPLYILCRNPWVIVKFLAHKKYCQRKDAFLVTTKSFTHYSQLNISVSI